MSFTKIVLNNTHDGSLEDWTPLNEEKLNAVFDALQLTKPVAISLMSDEELLAMNRQVLNHDYYTDVITMDYSNDSDFEYNEIYISSDRVKENAKSNQVTYEKELQTVCIHGLLHLAGYDDKTDEQIEKMREQEKAYLSLYRST
jgi:rRNA maturation RNase YbeY